MNNDISKILDIFKTLGSLFLVVGLIFVILLVFYIVTVILFYDKCKRPSWGAIIPFYNTWIFNDLAGCHWIIFVITKLYSILTILNIGNFRIKFLFWLLASFGNLVISYNTSLKFNKKNGFFIGLFLLPIIFIPILAFSKNNIYDEKVKVKNCGFFDIEL